MPELRLSGCASRPLVGYLKALGVLRAVGMQVDLDARGRWRDGTFELRSTLDDDDLNRFLLEKYAPAPVVSPWNGGSGFHLKDRQKALHAIEESATARLASYRRTIDAVRRCLDVRGLTDKPATEEKPALIRLLRRTAPDEALPWFDAAVVIRSDGLSFPPLLGSGGNDGRFDFSNNYAHCVVECVLEPDDERAAANLAAALLGRPTELKRKLSLAHFSRDSSPNNSPHGEADSLGNPWDLILAVEGSLLLAAGAARRHDSGLTSSLVAPFTVRQTSAGYGSAVDGESGRAELWLPLWDGWASLAEISTLAREARAQVRGARSRQATTGLDFARAAGELGVARGITGFERYALLERAGQATLAVPTGRISVENRRGAEALDGIDSWLSSLRRLGRDDRCPQGPRIAIRRLDEVAFDLAARDDPSLACSTLEAIGAVEASLSRSSYAGGAVRPLSGPPAGPWILAAEDGTPEFAVAVAIASLRDPRRSSSNAGAGLPELRDYLHGTRRGAKGTEHDPDRRHAIAAQNPIALFAAIHARRHLDASRANTGRGEGAASEKPVGGGRPHLEFPLGTWAPLESIRLLATDALDDRRILALVRGLALLRYTGKEPLPRPVHRVPQPQPALDLLELAWRPVAAKGIDERVRRGGDPAGLGARPGWAARLAAGATQAVIHDADRRLRMAGLPPRLDPDDFLLDRSRELERGRRLGAALLARLGPRDIRSATEDQILDREDDNHDTKDAP